MMDPTNQVISSNTGVGRDESLLVSVTVATTRAHGVFVEILCRKAGREGANLEGEILSIDGDGVNVPPHIEDVHGYAAEVAEAISLNGACNVGCIFDLIATRYGKPARPLEV